MTRGGARSKAIPMTPTSPMQAEKEMSATGQEGQVAQSITVQRERTRFVSCCTPMKCAPQAAGYWPGTATKPAQTIRWQSRPPTSRVPERADKTYSFRNGGVNHPTIPILCQQPLGDFVRPIVLGNLLPNHIHLCDGATNR